jgi:hypothetical protein
LNELLGGAMDKMEEWKNGRMEEWNGRMEEWNDGNGKTMIVLPLIYLIYYLAYC